MIKFYKEYSKGNFSELNSLIKIDVEKISNRIKVKNLLVKGSVGKGQLAAIPWICIFDKEITTSAQEGYYIVLLFDHTMKKVVLSLNQGYTYYKNLFGNGERGINKLKMVTEELQCELEGIEEFSLSSIDLNAPKNNSLASGYEAGHVCGKVYDLDNLNEEKFISDINKMVEVYLRLKNKIGRDLYNFNKDIIYKDIIGENKKSEKIKGNDLEKVYEKILNNKLDFILEDGLKEDLIKEKRQNKKNPRKNNYEITNLKKAKIGLIGELIILEREKNKLKKIGLDDKVEHSSIIKGDGLGYDILSIDKYNNPIYIEVKTTTLGSKNIFITKNELEFSKENSGNYELHIIYDFDYKSCVGKILVIKGDISEKLKLNPIVYQVEF